MCGKPFVSNSDIDEAMKTLNTEFRNQFSHFKPIGWSIEISRIKKILQITLPIIIFITSEFQKEGMGRVRILMEENEQSAIDEMLKKIILRSKF